MKERNGRQNNKDCVQGKSETLNTEDDTPEKTEQFSVDSSTQETASNVTEAKNTPEEPIKPVFKQKTRTPRTLDLRLLDIRVGRVEDVDRVEDEENVFTIEIDIKKPQKRIASAHLSCAGFDIYDLIDTKVVTVLNAPITYLSDETECNARVLAAVRMGGEDGTVVKAIDILRPPKKAKRGYRVYAEGYVQEQYWAIKEKMYNIIKKELAVNLERQAVYRWIPLKVDGCSGYVTTETLAECYITHI